MYADLKSSGIDPSDRSSHLSRPSRFEPLRHDAVRDLADVAASVLSRAMLTDAPDPLAAAAWQAQIALTRVAELLDPAPDQGFERPDRIEDLAARGDAIRRASHRLLAAEHSVSDLAARTEQHYSDLAGEQAVVVSAHVRLCLPNGETIRVELAANDGTRPGPAWTWRSDSRYVVGEANAEAQLAIVSALDTIGGVLTEAFDEDALAGQIGWPATVAELEQVGDLFAALERQDVERAVADEAANWRETDGRSGQ